MAIDLHSIVENGIKIATNTTGEKKTEQVPVLDENGNIVTDDQGYPIYKTVTTKDGEKEAVRDENGNLVTDDQGNPMLIEHFLMFLTECQIDKIKEHLKL